MGVRVQGTVTFAAVAAGHPSSFLEIELDSLDRALELARASEFRCHWEPLGIWAGGREIYNAEQITRLSLPEENGGEARSQEAAA